MMNGKKFMLGLLCVIFALSFVGWMVVRVVKDTSFEFQCESYLKRAADANTVELAKPQLDTAIAYLEKHNLTEGIPSIFLRNPANDIGFFYQNLKACQAELERFSPAASQLEESNLLMKLRESLLDEGESTKVTLPTGISVYPANAAYFWWAVISLIAAFLFGFFCWLEN